MKFNGTKKQNEWANKIIDSAQLTESQIDNLLRFAGPTLHAQGIMDATIVIENRFDLASYADSLGKFYALTAAEKTIVAEEAAAALRGRKSP